MKKIFILLSISTTVLFLSNCGTAKKTTAVPKLTYESNLKPLIMANCSPCHIPAKGGNKKPYDNYNNVKTDIDEMIRRIELHPGDKGFMPFKRDRLSDSLINVFKQWRIDGALEK